MSEQTGAKILPLNGTLADPDASAEAWVERYSNVHNIRYSYKTNSILENGEPVESSLFLAQMRLCAHSLGLMDVKRMLPDALMVWRKERAREFLSSLREEMSFEGGVDLVSEWVEATTGSRNELDVAVVRHFIWQVKRKLFGLPVEHHMMVVLVGQSGGGKSVAVHKLIEPLTEVVSLRDMTIFNDQFARRAFARNFIIFFDELGRCEDTDVNALKNIITAPRVDWRGMGSETTHSASQNSSFIGCSNVPVRERIKDPTSTRRFWELRCQSQLDWAKVNSIDYLALWRSVDESGPSPLTSVLGEVRSTQESTLKHVDLIEYWLETCCEPCPFTADSPATEDLYSNFAEWCRAQTIWGHEGVQSFAKGLVRRIENLGWQASSKRSYRGTTWSLRLKTCGEKPEAGAC